MEEVQLTPGKSFKIELLSDKNNSYLLEFKLNNNIEITANQINNIIHKSYLSKYSFEEIRETKYFLQFDTFSEILDEIKDRIYYNKIIIKENENKLVLNITLPDNKEIIFESNEIIENNNDRLNELTDLIMKLNTKINNIKNEEISKLKKEINNMRNKEVQLTNDNTQLKNDINLLKNEINYLKKDNNKLKNDNIQLKNNEARLRNEIAQLKKEVTQLKENINILGGGNKMIFNLDSKIINGNKKYNESLKYWINPSRKIKAELLYRLSENRDNKSIFHKLCDNKGPTLTLFHVNDGNIVGIYTPLSWDSSLLLGQWKNDMDTFIFNLNKNQKYKKLKFECSIFCSSSYGPNTAEFGCGFYNSMKSIIHNANDINNYFDIGSEVLPSYYQNKVYNLIETEVYKIIIE